MSADDAPAGGGGGFREALSPVDDRLQALSWWPIVKKDFQDAVRSLGLLFVSVTFVALFLLPVAITWYTDFRLVPQQVAEVSDIGMQLIISVLYLNIVTVLVPLVAIFAGYAAISGERESGSLKLLLSLPYSRLDVVVGKVIGRSLVVAVPLAVVFAATAGFFVLSDLTFKPELYALFSLYSLLLTVVWVAIAVSISGAVPTNKWSALGNTFVYLYLTFAWNSLANGIGNILGNELGVTGALRWHVVLFVKLLNPNQAYKTLTNSMLGEGGEAARSARFGMINSANATELETVCAGVLRGNATMQPTLRGNTTMCNQAATSMPVYYSDAAVFLYMLLALVVAAALSYYTFNKYDL